MSKFIKVLCVILAVLMLVGMATACKKGTDDDEFDILEGSGTVDDNGDESGDESNDETDGETDAGTDGNNGGNSGNNGGNTSTNNGNNGGNNGGNTEETKKPETQQQVQDDYEASKKYDMANNPLVAETKKLNYGTEVSYDIDTTGFVKNVKVADLKGKSLVAITSLEVSNFIYRGPKGELLNEWTWFDSLKKTYGVKFTYVESRWDKAPALILNYMQAGKQLDIIPTHRSGLAQLMNLSQPLDPYINSKYINNSPGIDTRTMEQSKRYDG